VARTRAGKVRCEMSNRVVCALFDVNAMQALNDKRGYDIGDRVLHGIEGALKSMFRPASVVRLPGDEFLVVTNAEDFFDVKDKASVIAQQTKREFNVGLTYGLGVGATLIEGKQAAALALFRCKQAGEN
jgi:diguanylate cyclase (GGDEF)-like protein